MTRHDATPEEFPSATPAGLEQVTMLRTVHKEMRADLDAIRRAIDGLVDATVSADDAKTAIGGLRIASHDWQLGTLCDRYCNVVNTHHEIEDSRVFPTIVRLFPHLADTIDALKAEHVILARLLQRAQRSLNGPDDIQASRAALEELADHLETHLNREEDALLPAIAQLPAWI